MLNKILISAVTAVALATAVTSISPAAAAPATTIDVSWNGGSKGYNQGQDEWKGHGGKHGGHEKWQPRRACEPIVRWKKVGYRYHRRWEPIVVGWNCQRGHRGPKGGENWKWR